MINLGDDIIDSRDIIKRIDELESEAADLAEELEDLTNSVSTLDGIQDDIACAQDELGDLKDELTMWRLFEDAGVADWHHGEAFIHENYFVEYTKQLVDDCYEKPEGYDPSSWPWCCMEMDWDAAADMLQQDYTCVEIDNENIYWARA